jgi:hypothetical protein
MKKRVRSFYSVEKSKTENHPLLEITGCGASGWIFVKGVICPPVFENGKKLGSTF